MNISLRRIYVSVFISPVFVRRTMLLLKNYIILPSYLQTNNSYIAKEWDWRNISGKSYITKSLNQHIPQCKCEALLEVGRLSDITLSNSALAKNAGRETTLRQFALLADSL